MQLIDIHHVNIKTQDLDATDRFYGEILGLRRAQRPDFDFPGSWFELGRTQIHIMAGKAGLTRDGTAPFGGAAVDHVAMEAHGFHAVKREIIAHGLEWRQFAIPEAGLWQLFFHDPNGVLIELNFAIANEPEGTTGPDDSSLNPAGRFFATPPK